MHQFADLGWQPALILLLVFCLAVGASYGLGWHRRSRNRFRRNRTWRSSVL